MRSLWAGLVVVVGAAGTAHAQAALSGYNVDPSTVTVSGISSGGFMAVQLQVAYSSRFFGTAVFAGGPYGCAASASSGACTAGTGLNVASMVTYTQNQASAGKIDPTADIAGKPIYMFSGTQDLIVSPNTMKALQQYYGSFTSASEVTFNSTTPAQHAWIAPDAGNSCTHLGPPYINDCGLDAEQTFLSLFYGALAPRNDGALSGSFIQINQNAFCPGGSCSGISMDSTAWVFVPQSCASGQSCRLVVALHGCAMYQGAIGQQFVQKSGLNAWADTNGIVVLYPQATTSLSNALGCWDWWGYTNASYNEKSGVQMTAIMGMVDKIVSGHTGGGRDGGTGGTDAGGTSGSDGGSTGGADAGNPGDGGSVGAGDSGQPQADAGPGQGGDGGGVTGQPDGGSTGGNGGGCGCSAPATGALSGLALLALAAIARRRGRITPR